MPTKVKFSRGNLVDVDSLEKVDGQVIYCLDSDENVYCQYIDYLDDNEVLQRVKVTDSELKKSVSDGKKEVATAITNKGVTTASDASFHTMATNIGRISGSETPAVTVDMTNKAVIADNAHETYKCVTVEPYYNKNIVEDSLGYYTEVFENSQTTPIYDNITEYGTNPIVKQALFPANTNYIRTVACNYTTNCIGTGTVMARPLQMRGGAVIPLSEPDKMTTTYTTAANRYAGKMSKILRDILYDLIMSHEVGQSTNPYDSTLPFVSKFSAIEVGDTITATDAPYKVEEDVDMYGLSIGGLNIQVQCKLNTYDSALYAKNNKTSTTTHTKLIMDLTFKDYYYSALGNTQKLRSNFFFYAYTASIPWSELNYTDGTLATYLRNRFYIMGTKNNDFVILIAADNTGIKKPFMRFHRQKNNNNSLDVLDGYSFYGNGLHKRYENGGSDVPFIYGKTCMGPFTKDGYYQPGAVTAGEGWIDNRPVTDILTSTPSSNTKAVISRYTTMAGIITNGSPNLYGSASGHAVIFTEGTYLGSQYLFKANNYYKLDNDIYYCIEDGYLLKVREGAA